MAQKRGIPHAHILIILQRGEIANTSEQFDKIAFCEIPDPITNPVLYSISTTKQFHRPCEFSTEHHMEPCRIDDPENCKSGFPKNFNEETSVPENANYPHYRL